MKNIPEGYKKEKNRIIPLDWNFVKINSILQKIGDKVDVNKEESYQQIGIRSHGKGLFYKEPVTGDELGNKSVFWIEKDCFIVNIVFAWEQAVGRTTENEVGMICSHRFPMYSPIDNKVDIDYLVYLFKTPYGKKVLELASPGGAGRNKTLGQKEFANSEILIPSSIEEQKKIMKILSLWDLVIEKEEQLLEKKKELRKGLIQRVLCKRVRFANFQEEWKERCIGEFLVENKEKTVYDNQYEILTSSRNGMYLQSEYFSKQVASKNNTGYRVIKRGQFTYRAMSDDGNFTFNRQDIIDIGCVSPAYAVFEANKDIDAQFLFYILNSNMFSVLVKSNIQGGTRLALRFSELKKIKIKIPELEEQKKIAEILITYDKEIELVQKELEALKLQKKGLMQRLLTGEVRVKV